MISRNARLRGANNLADAKNKRSPLLVLALCVLPYQILIALDNSFTFQSAGITIALFLVAILVFREEFYMGTFEKIFLFGFMFAMGLGCFITLLVSPEMVVSTVLLRMGLFTLTVFFFVVETSRIWSKDELLLSIRSIAVSAAAASFLVVLAYVQQGNFWGRIYPDSLLGHIIDANYFALLIVLQIQFALLMAFYEKRVFLRVFGFALAALGFLAIILTGSRSGLLCAGLVVFFSIFAFYREKHVPKLFTTILLLVCLAVGFALISSMVSDWLFERFFVNSYNDDSNKFRVELWAKAVERWTQRPIFGFGIGNYNYFASGDWGSDVTTVTTHGTLTDFLVDFGAFGFCLFVACQIRFIRDAMKGRCYPLLAGIPGITICWIIIGAERSVALWLYLILFTVISRYCVQNSVSVSEIFRTRGQNEN